MRNAVVATFFVQGFLFASWTAHIPHIKDHLHLDGSLGIALLGAPIGSMLAMLAVSRLLPKFGSRRVVRVALVGYCLAGPLVGLSTTLVTFFIAFLLWGVFQGSLDVSMNAQAIAVEGKVDRRLMPGFHGSWSMGSLAGAGVGVLGVGLGWSLSEQLLIFAAPCLVVVGWLSTRMIPNDQAPVESSSGLSEETVAGVSCRKRLSFWRRLRSPTCSVRERLPTGRRCTCTERSTRRPSSRVSGTRRICSS